MEIYIKQLEEDVLFLIFTEVNENRMTTERAQELAGAILDIVKEGTTAEQLKNSLPFWEKYPEFQRITEKIKTDIANNKIL